MVDGDERRSAAAIKLDVVLLMLPQPKASMWTHTALAQALHDRGLAVSPDQVTAMRAGSLPVPERVRSAFGDIFEIPAPFWDDEADPEHAGALLDLTLATRAVTTPPRLTDLANRLTAHATGD